MGSVTVFCPPTIAGSGLVTGVQTAGGPKLVALSRLTFPAFAGQAMRTLAPERGRESDSDSPEVKRKRKNRF